MKKIGDSIRVEKGDGIVREGVVLRLGREPGTYDFDQVVCYRKETGEPVKTADEGYFCFHVTEDEVTGPAEYVTTAKAYHYLGSHGPCFYVMGYRPEDAKWETYSSHVTVKRYSWVKWDGDAITEINLVSGVGVDYFGFSRRLRDGKLYGKMRRYGQDKDYTAKKLARKALGLK